MASKAINRYVWLLNTLMQRKSLTFKEICDLWDRSSLNDGKPLALRTFHQHREAIAELFGVEIVCDSNTYKYSIASPEELKNNAAQQWLFNSFAIANTIEAGRNMKDRILFEEIPSGA
ncbi:MAG: WYL domain-containing protein, partial [Rikenellaceae bacterium]|nr:WYL domain-containing protein [Rikenellaceae bacterium]